MHRRTAQRAAERRQNLAQGAASEASETLGYSAKTNQARFSGRQNLVLLLSLVAVLSISCKRKEGGISSGAGGWPPSSSSPAISSSLDIVKMGADSVAVSIGSHADAKIVLTIAPGFHVNANPATFPYLIATKLEAGNTDGMITTGKPGYPAAQTRRFQFAEEPLAVYEKEITLTLPLQVTPKATRGLVSLPISVTVQACDEEKCYPPGVLNAAIPIEVK